MDSYAALLLKALADYAKAGGSAEYVQAHSEQIDSVMGALMGVMNEQGYSWAKPDYQVAYLMDNCEVFAGLQAAEYLYSGPLSSAGNAEEILPEIKERVSHYKNDFENDWWAGDHYRPVLQNEGETDFAWNNFYPDLTAQMFPVLYSLTGTGNAHSKAVQKKINSSISWQTLQYMDSGTDDFYWGAFMWYGALMKDSRAASYFSEYEKRTSQTGRVYPLYCGDSAMVLNGLNVLDGSVKFADPADNLNEKIAGLKPGDTLLLHGGNYEGNYKINSKVKGKADQRITIASAPGERAVFTGENQSKGKALLTMRGCSYITVKNMEFCNATGNNACGVLVESGTSHFKIYGCEFHNITCEGKNSANAILLFGESPKYSIKYGEIRKNNVHDCRTGWGEAISITGNVYKVNSRYNTVKNTGNIGIDYSGNYGYCSKASVDFPRKCIVEYNQVEDCVSSYATSYGIYVDGGQNITIRYNTVTGCSGGIEIGAEEKPKSIKYSTSNITVRKNKIKNNLENGITVGGYKKTLGWVRNVTISYNTCINNGSDSLTLSKCDYVTIKGNRFYNKSKNSSAVYSAMGKKYTKHIKFYKNKYGTKGCRLEFRGKTYRTMKAWRKATGDKKSQLIK